MSDDRVWLANCWQHWEPGGNSARDIDRTTAERPYRHWHLAVELVGPDADDIRRGAAIHKLWNAIESRVRMLHQQYRLHILKGVLSLPKRTDTFEVLAHIGLARPFILRQLKDIRNSVEHQDRGAPSHADCLRHIDSVWYFLRSTDLFAARQIDSFDRTSLTGQFAEFSFAERDWMPRVRGWFPSNAIRTRSDPGTLELRLEQPLTTSDDGDVYVVGGVAAPSPMLEQIVRDYFLVDLPDSSSLADETLQQNSSEEGQEGG